MSTVLYIFIHTRLTKSGNDSELFELKWHIRKYILLHSHSEFMSSTNFKKSRKLVNLGIAFLGKYGIIPL
jgi:hypothetical protein